MITKLLVCLDLSPYDKACVEQAVLLSRHLTSIEKVVLLHNIRFDFLNSVPEFAQRDYDGLRSRIEEAIAERYKDRFDARHLPQVKVTKRDYTIDAISEELGDSGQTLLIVGQKRRKDGAGIVPLRILQLDEQRSPILFTPKKQLDLAPELVIATDLSKQNVTLFHFAKVLGEALSAQLTSLHISRLPMAYFPYIGKNDTEMKQQVLRQAEKKVKKFIESQPDLAVDRIVTLSSNNVARSIADFYTDSAAGLLLLNRSSRSNLEADVVGSITRSILADPIGKPVLVI